MKTGIPLILTARVAEPDMAPFDLLRRQHFPPDRNHLRAHLTMFHRLPGEKRVLIEPGIAAACAATPPIAAVVSGLRHLGAGVAFTVASAELEALRAGLKAEFLSWLNPQDLRGWRPHITIQNKVSRDRADALYRTLTEDFAPSAIRIMGVDLWTYLGGPWRHEAYLPFGAATP